MSQETLPSLAWMRKQVAALVIAAHEALFAAGEVKAGEREGTRSVSTALMVAGRLPPPGPVPDMGEYGRLPRPATSTTSEKDPKDTSA
ncbi:hypothetical protein GCM10010448_63600 [Streptomyces glomeratus]|uniref:Uncharacterized protein n=1 Tax=Streptomyces glomeratus TaxID=284452 RepID=A0ABP6M1E6_9ACTN